MGGELKMKSASTRVINQDNAVLKLASVQKSFGSMVAVENVDVDVKENELVTLLGPSGCGKTTTLRMIAGFEYPTSGQIVIDGEDVTFTPPNKREIGIVFQSYSLFPHMRVTDNIAYGLKRRGVPRAERNERVREVLDLVDLGQFGERFPRELSGGQQQRVAIARAIVIRPKILLLDEPLSALDAKLRQRMRFEIRRLQRQIGMTTVLVTHDQEEALAMSDRIVVMNKGRVEQNGTPTNIYQAPNTSFVATFIGETNLFEATVVGSAESDGMLIVRGDDGFESSMRAPRRVEPGSRVLVSLRPESLALSANTNPLNVRNNLKGVVLGKSYLGARTVFDIKTASREILVSIQNETGCSDSIYNSISEGQAVTISWAAESCQFVEAI
jgi:spermidine/putrescine ABC transporter ATP-binding subunit